MWAVIVIIIIGWTMSVVMRVSWNVLHTQDIPQMYYISIEMIQIDFRQI